MSIVVTLSNIKKDYALNNGVVPVLDIPEFQINKGIQAVLVGESGSGKSTLVNIIAGLTLPTSGEVIFKGQNIYQLNEGNRDVFRAQNIGYIPQNASLISSLTALENVLLPMHYGKTIPKAEQMKFAKELLGQVRMGDRLDHKPGQLSRGEQQRVAVARALANRGSLILADEPTGSVDMNNGKNILNEIRKLLDHYQTALLLVTHNQYVVDEFETVVQMKDINKITGGNEG